VAILQLDQAGRISIDDALAAHLPSLATNRYAEVVTLRELLTHTGGAGDYWTHDYEGGWDAITSLPQMLPFVLPHLGRPSRRPEAHLRAGGHERNGIPDARRSLARRRASL
jgi:CubicO group peptidase (beta-lactamase class C family)